MMTLMIPIFENNIPKPVSASLRPDRQGLWNEKVTMLENEIVEGAGNERLCGLRNEKFNSQKTKNTLFPNPQIFLFPSPCLGTQINNAKQI